MAIARPRPLRGQRGLLRRRPALPAGLRRRPRPRQRQRRRHRHGPPARRHRRDDPRHRSSTSWSAATRKPASPPSASAPAWAPPPSSRGCDDRHRTRVIREMPEAAVLTRGSRQPRAGDPACKDEPHSRKASASRTRLTVRSGPSRRVRPSAMNGPNSRSSSMIGRGGQASSTSRARWRLMGSSTAQMPGEDRLDLSRALRLADGRPLLAPARPGRGPHPVRRQPRDPRTRRPLVAPPLAPRRGRVRHGHRGRARPRPGRGRIRHAPRRLRRLEGRRHATATASSTAPTARPASSSSAPRRRTRSPPTPTSTSCCEVKDGAAASPTSDGTPWTGPR